jgi:methyl-accepting chemotaxis protein
VKGFRIRCVIVLVAVCAASAYAMQVFIGLFVRRDLPGTLAHLGAFNFVVPLLAAAGGLGLWLILGPLDAASRPASRTAVGSARSGPGGDVESRSAARDAAGKIPILVAVIAIAGFVIGPAATMIANAAAGQSYAPGEAAIFFAVSLAFGYMGGLQAVILIESLIREPITSLGFRDMPGGKRRTSLSSRFVLAGTASAFLALVLAAAAGYGALTAGASAGASAGAGPEPRLTAAGFLLESLALAAFVLAWALALFRTVGRTIAARSKEAGKLIRSVAEGESDLSIRVPILNSDEISEITAAFNLFLDRLGGLVRSVRELSTSIERGAGKLGEMAEEARGSVAGLSLSVESVRDAVQRQSDTVSSTEGEISSLLDSIGQVAGKVVEQSGFMDQSSAAVSEMAANIASVSKTAERADGIASALQKASEEGGQALRASILSIAEIDEASRSVRDIIGVISKISAQTNLLAMNAAIEAAHAGDAGKGFAVVADEVRSLAETSARSAKEIELLIRGMTDKTNRGSSLADSAGKAFDRITEGVAQTSELVRTIAASMGEQREGAEEILRSAEALSEATRLIESLTDGQKTQSKEMEQSMLRIVSASNEIFEAVQEETGATQSLGRIVAMVSDEAKSNSDRVRGLEEAVSKFKTGAAS